MAAGDFTELAIAAARWRSSAAPPASIFTMRCASGASPERALQIAREREWATFGDASDFADERVCRAWGVAPLPETFRAPVRSAVPTLFVSGTLDGDTPEANAAEVLRGFAGGEHLHVEGGAHLYLGFAQAATRDAVVRFFDGGSLRTARVRMSALAFERPDPVRRGPSGPRLARADALPVLSALGGTP
jgi:pimeloyl-ACP methyl ester carboxylesterase